MNSEKTVINSLWIGETLSNLELLTLNSFVKRDHEFYLWAYSDLNSQIPKGVILKDANSIIPKDQIFTYKTTSKCGLGKGSVAGFSDIFRYKLLYEIGGWWVDMDITCLKHFDSTQPYLFPKEIHYQCTGKVLKAPKQSDLMLDCLNESLQTVNEDNDQWTKPIDILIKNISKYDLNNYIIPEFTNYDSFIYVDLYKHYQIEMPMNLYAFHWSHEFWRSNKVNKNNYKLKTTYGQLLVMNNVVSENEDEKWEIKYSWKKKIQLQLFKFLHANPFLWQVLKKIKNKLSDKYILWIP